MAGFLFSMESITYAEALAVLGGVVTVSSVSSLLIKFSPQDEKEARAEMLGSTKGQVVRPGVELKETASV